MWREIGLLGRDRLLAQVLPRVRQGRPVLLVGQRGVGRSAVLQWVAHHAGPRAVAVSAARPAGDTLRAILAAWGVDGVPRGDAVVPIARATVAELDAALARQPAGGVICLDDLDAASPAMARRIRAWREHHVVHAAAVPPLREHLAPLTWGMHTVELPPLRGRDAERLAAAICRHVGSPHPPSDVARLGRGVPARMVRLARGELEATTQRVMGEELDLSPALLLGLAAVVAVRVVGVVSDAPDLYAIGGMGLALGLLGRWAIARGGR